MTENESARVLVVDVSRDEIRGPAGRREAASAIGRIDRPFLAADQSTSAVAELAERLRSVVPRGRAKSAAVVVTHPSGWGALRRSMLAEAAGRLGDEVQLAPRAVAIARSHLGAATGRYVVIEVFDDRADLHTLRCHDGHWEVVDSRAGQSDSSAIRSLIAAGVPDDVEAVLVDATDPEPVRTMVQLIEQSTVVGRVIPVDRWLLIRFGAGNTVTETAEATPGGSEARAARRLTPVLAMVALVAVLIVVGLMVVDHRHENGTARARPDPSRGGSAAEHAVIGRVRVAMPAGWTQTREPRTAGPAPVWPRTAFADPADDRRIIVMQFVIRAGATQQTVASSLRARIEQRGNDDVQNFQERRVVGTREVIGYRELSGSGHPVDWYVVVGDRLQVSVGCQAGSATDVAEACERAVGSLVIDPG